MAADPASPLSLQKAVRLRERVKMARATESLMAADEVVLSYQRLRQEARELHESFEWDPCEFDREVPPWVDEPPSGSRAVMGMGDPVRQSRRMERARHLLGQLEGYVNGLVDVAETERRLQLDSEVRAKQREKPNFGFSG